MFAMQTDRICLTDAEDADALRRLVDRWPPQPLGDPVLGGGMDGT
jgi:hypothetical protein